MQNKTIVQQAFYQLYQKFMKKSMFKEMYSFFENIFSKHWHGLKKGFKIRNNIF